MSQEVTPSVEAGVFISKINFFNGPALELQDDSIVVLVGPNNSGKSQTLRELAAFTDDYRHAGLCIRDIELQKVGSFEDVLRTIEPFYNKHTDRYYFSGRDSTFTSSADIRRHWEGSGPNLGELAKSFISYLSTQNRLADCAPAEIFDARKVMRGAHPIHQLYLDQELELKTSEIYRNMFGVDLIVHRSAGRTIPLYVGDRPRLSNGETHGSRTYIDKLETLSQLEHQGDGLKSFASLLIRIYTGASNVILVDEPEAFLHPPQARAVGEMINAASVNAKQIFIATHSNDVLQGLMNQFPGRISIVRMSGKSGGYKSSLITSESISRLWKDPILRYSNALSGLFHDMVIVTEADGDCRFYEAVAKAIDITTRDVLYTYAGGKERIAVIVRALAAADVPTRAVVDFDVFANEGSLERIVSAFGLDWKDYKTDASNLRKAIESRKGWLIGDGFKARIQEIIDNVEADKIVSPEIISRIKLVMREASPWDYVKLAGVKSVPTGSSSAQLSKVLDQLSKNGLYVVPEGEMEGFCRSVGGHGPKWVENVLEKDLAIDPELDSARLFVRQILDTGSKERSVRPLPFDAPRKFEKRNYLIIDNRTKYYLSNAKTAAKAFMYFAIGAFLTYAVIMPAIKK